MGAMVRDGRIEPTDQRVGYRKFYRLTKRGLRKLEQESPVLKRAAQLAQERLRGRYEVGLLH